VGDAVQSARIQRILKKWPVYAASRMSQLRKSSSATSQLLNDFNSAIYGSGPLSV
jgi:hypothetical protein